MSVASPNSKSSSSHSLSPSNSPNISKEQRVGPYLLGKTLGVGMTGRVKLGTHCNSGEKVAVKIIAKDILSSKTAKDGESSALQKVEREITIMKLITHENVMQLYDVYETEKQLYLVLEHVQGGELFDYLVKKGRLQEVEARKFFQQIISGLDHCHRHLICHRDLKPENLLLDRNMNVKIADFGMASIQANGKLLETSCGSPHYASPEIIKGGKYDGTSSDIWSCGVILYALLTGSLPFDDENIRKLLGKVKNGLYYMPDYIMPEGRDLIRRMLVVDPDNRISMKQIIQHPWFLPNSPINSDYERDQDRSHFNPVTDEDDIDQDIINSLKMLGWEDEGELIEKLMNSIENQEKVYYNLLCKRKIEFYENFDITKLSEWDIAGGPTRRADSHYSLYSGSQIALNCDWNTTLSRNSTEEISNKSDHQLKMGASGDLTKSLQDLSSDSGPSLGRKSPTLKNRHLENTTSLPQTLPKKKSPLSASMTAFDTPIIEEQKVMSIAKIPSESPEKVSPQESSPNLMIAPQSPNQNNFHRKSPLSISIPLLVSGSAAIGTPRFHRTKNVIPIPATPVMTSTPKRSWFANLFSKPETTVIETGMKTAEITAQSLLEIFDEIGVKYQTKKENNSYKCKFTGYAMSESPHSQASGGKSPFLASPSPVSPMFTEVTPLAVEGASIGKSIKFKVDITSQDSSNRVQLIHQQGPVDIFQILSERLKHEFSSKET